MYAGSSPSFLHDHLVRLQVALLAAILLTVVLLLAFGASEASAAAANQPDPNIVLPYRW